ncbi:hypothetical protein EKK58_04250 [Candidatus Dependentiae bacterium]|nr:MAG: hypothetical protein EKK58_04250 [Candidatus Dependentiae bacterium]
MPKDILNDVEISEEIKNEIRSMKFSCSTVMRGGFSATANNEKYTVYLVVDNFDENELIFPMNYSDFEWDQGWISYSDGEMINF